MENKFIKVLQEKVTEWKNGDYNGVEKETKNIINYIKKVGYLHQPQLEAFETYVYLKEIVGNVPFTKLVKTIFDDDRSIIELLELNKEETLDILLSKDKDEKINQLINDKFNGIDYPNQIYALSMGTGKTILMGVMMLYDFVLSYYHKDDKRFAKNALVFAPDTTIIESLKEIKTFDSTTVIPKEYQHILLNIKYHYLESPETPLNPIGNYNVIVSNSQKIILKTQHKEDSRLRLFRDVNKLKNQAIENRRLQAIRSLNDLIIFVDEAHHSFGTTLEGALKKTRETINFIHKEGNPLVATINLTGTPYVNNKMLPHVVYFFGLKQGIEKGILKQVRFFTYGNVQTKDFIEDVIDKFWSQYGEKRLEGKLPKIAFYAPSIDSLQSDLRPTIQSILVKKGISTDKILEYHTEAEKNKDDFFLLDTDNSNKQFVLLVGKGTEGWNCRSLVSCALYRKPKSSIFVLQSSTRCLRCIGDNSTFASIFLSSENAKILDKELKNNFSTSIEELKSQSQEVWEHTLKVEKRKTIKVNKILKEILSIMTRKSETIKIDWGKYKADKYKPFISQSQIMLNTQNQAEYKQNSALQDIKISGSFSFYQIIEIINRYTHLDCLDIEKIIDTNVKNREDIVTKINNDPNLIYFIIDSVLTQAFEYQEKVSIIEEELELTKMYPFKISVDKHHNKLIIYKQDTNEGRLGFHINPYNFDSQDEKDLFINLRETLEKDETITDVYFTGGVVDPSHNDFYFEYFNPTDNKISKYFPDLLVETNRGRFLVVEVKSNEKKASYLENKTNYSKSKRLFDDIYAKELGFEEFQKQNKNFSYHIIFDTGLDQAQKELYKKLDESKI